MEKEVKPPTSPKDLARHNKNAMNTKLALLDPMKDHIIPHITKKSTAKEMYDALGTLYQSVNVSKKIFLRHKFIATIMCKTSTKASYLMKLAKLRDQLGVVSDEVKDDELFQIALNGFNRSWHNFVWVISSQENSPNFEKLRDAFIKEEMRLQQVSTNYKDKDNALDLALIGKVKKGDRKGGPRRG